MAVQAVGIGSSANDGTGDPLRTAFNKINENFTEVYSLLGQDVAGAKGIDISGSTIGSTETNADIIINPNGTGLVELAANVQIDNAILVNGSAISSLVTNADITLAPSGTGNINLTAGADVIIPANIGLTFGTGEKIEGDSTDLTVTSGGALNLTATTDIVIPTSVGILMAGTEKIESDGTDLTFTVGAGGDINIGSSIGLTFGNDGEKIEGNGTDLTITGNIINLTATEDVALAINTGLLMAGAEKIESDGTDLSITVGAGGDINIGTDIGLTFGNDGEKIEGNGTDLTITGNIINLTATEDVSLAVNTGLLFAGQEKIESDGTDLTITVGAGGDINLGTDIGVTFGNDGEKIEGDGTDLTIASSCDLNITNTGTMVISGSVKRALVTIAATDNITQIEHAGRVNLLGEVGGNALVTLTLPAATGSGLEYKFIVSVVNTSSYVIQVADATDTIDGSVNILDADANAQAAFVTVAASDTVTLNGTTSGGASIGDTLTLTDIAANQYAIEGQLVCAAGSNPATPFTAAVS